MKQIIPYIAVFLFSLSLSVNAQETKKRKFDLSKIVTPTQEDFLMPSGLDGYNSMSLINKASLIGLVETQNLTVELGARIGKGIYKVDSLFATPGVKRSPDYLVFEPELIKAVGSDASRLHTGRSRQDMKSTSNRMYLRESLLETFEQLNEAREAIQTLAAKHTKTIIPAYTHGVQAQPTTLAHYLLAVDAAFQRHAEKFRTAYAYINKSPLGAEVVATSVFYLDRKRLAELLAFDGVIENAYDANHWPSEEANLELSNAIAVSAITIGQFVQDLHLQYSSPIPWILINEGPLTGVSSNMPQKRNPKALEDLREISSGVIGEAQTVYFLEHNVNSGMDDYRRPLRALTTSTSAQVMFALTAELVRNFNVNVARALEEVNQDYSTTASLAEILQRDANVPFRIGHHFASELTNYGRSHNLYPNQIPYAEAKRIYQEATEGQVLPFDEKKFREALSAEYLVFNRKGLGGSQLSEVERMLGEQNNRLTADRTWVKTQMERLYSIQVKLDKEIGDFILKASGK